MALQADLKRGNDAVGQHVRNHAPNQKSIPVLSPEEWNKKNAAGQ